MKPKLAILGATYLQLPLVKKAKELNIETHCFAWDNDYAVCKYVTDFFYPISVLDKESIYLKCQEIGINGITTIATDICVPTVSYVAEKLNLTGNSTICSILSTNKAKMREALKKSNLLSPKYYATHSVEELETSDLEYPLIVKPSDRSGSRAVVKVINKEQLTRAVVEAIEASFENSAIIEEYIFGNEISVESISWQGQHYVLAITDKVVSEEPYFVELEHHQPSQLAPNIQEKVKNLTPKVLDVLQIKNGASHTEFKITEDGKIHVIEVGARMGGDFIGSHLVEYTTGYDYNKGVIDVALGKFSKPKLSPKNYAGVYFLSKDTEYLLKHFDIQKEFIMKKSVQNVNLKMVKNSNDRSGYLIYKSNKRVNLQP